MCQYFGNNTSEASAKFSLRCSVWFGGYVCDLCGGYRGGGQQRVAVRVTTLFAGENLQMFKLSAAFVGRESHVARGQSCTSPSS